MAIDFTDEQIAHLATLARLRLTEPEVRAIRADLSAILAYAQALDEVDVTDVPPTTHAPALPALQKMPLREDVIAPRLTHEQVLSNAPAAQDGQLRVPKVVDHG
jgi:aspartyl-tRNA(Asn)/glutamyl-tRNA(Gln) amidotransferase subunit C